jgi:tetratricopeptide (TPR) repeat protein
MFVTCACFCLSMCLVFASFAGAKPSDSTAIPSTHVSAKSVAHYIMGVSHDLLEDVPSAIREYEQAIEADPGIIDIRSRMASLYFSVGAADKAVLQFEKVLEQKPKDTDMAYLLGGYYAAAGKSSRAVPFFQQCIAADPFHDACLNGLGYTYAEEGRNLDEAESLIKRALESDPKDPAYLDSLGWVYYQQGKYVEALRELSAAVDLLDDPTIYEHLGEVYAKLGERSLAKAQWMKSLALDPDQPALRARLNDEKKTQDVPVGKTK